MEPHKLFERIPEQPEVSDDSDLSTEQSAVVHPETEPVYTEYRHEDFESTVEVSEALRELTEAHTDKRAHIIARILSGRNN